MKKKKNILLKSILISLENLIKTLFFLKIYHSGCGKLYPLSPVLKKKHSF
jgi:hypothetical protein